MLNRSLNNAHLILGTHAGKRLIQEMRHAKKSIFIITPYISDGYLDMLIEKAEQGIDVQLISTTELEGKYGSWDSYKRLIAQTKHTNKTRLKWYRNLLYTLYFLGLLVVCVSGIAAY